MNVYIVTTSWDIVGDGQGSDVIGVFDCQELAQKRFKGEIARIESEYPTELEKANIWDDEADYWSADNDDFSYNVDIIKMELNK